ncbi:MAG: DNA-(Apurinic or apyrimidinic site) lyase [candidate division TM6 bacterium GW2011_GWF2_30_66]|nr:MAG: DNA-(Apurinic or apyrimidinic site) lyase [candidate division TM6 bacterium GW2011_GWF2_30_66]
MKNLWFDYDGRIDDIIQKLIESTCDMIEPASISIVKKYGQEPFLVLVSCILSLRTKDTVSLPASIRLFSVAKTPEEILGLSLEKIEKIIYPTGFYRKKAKNLHEISKILINKYSGLVQNNEQDLLELPGVGRKTANLVLSVGFGVPAICVDTHVHRISNRLGLVKTKNPDETEIALKKILPQKYWLEYNNLLVKWGQNICVPISPHCSKCAISHLCSKISVKKSR